MVRLLSIVRRGTHTFSKFRIDHMSNVLASDILKSKYRTDLDPTYDIQTQVYKLDKLDKLVDNNNLDVKDIINDISLDIEKLKNKSVIAHITANDVHQLDIFTEKIRYLDKLVDNNNLLVKTQISDISKSSNYENEPKNYDIILAQKLKKEFEGFGTFAFLYIGMTCMLCFASSVI